MNEATKPQGVCPVVGHGGSLLLRSLAEPDILAKPYDYYAALRREDPVHYDEKLGMYMVSRYQDLQTVLRDPVTFSQEKGWNRNFARGYLDEFKAIMERDGGGFYPEAILRDPPRHARVRKLLEKAFSQHRVTTLEPQIRRVIGDLIERVADSGRADGVSDLAMPMTIGLMCEQLGIPHSDGPQIVEWTRAYIAQIGGMQTHDEMLANAKQICDLQHYVIARIKEREAKHTEDMISDLVYARLPDEENPTLTFGEILALVRTFIVGGNDTTATALTNLLHLVATRPHVAEALEASVNDNGRLTRFVEELIRIEPPARALFRVTTKDVELGGKHIPEDSFVCMIFASANEDEALFTCPREFDMDRKNLGRHVSFGGGIHLCVGMSLARMEIKVAAQEIIKRLKDIKLAVPAEEIKFIPSLSMLMMESLPLKFARR